MLMEAVPLTVGTWPIHILCIIYIFVRIWTKMCQFIKNLELSKQFSKVSGKSRIRKKRNQKEIKKCVFKMELKC